MTTLGSGCSSAQASRATADDDDVLLDGSGGDLQAGIAFPACQGVGQAADVQPLVDAADAALVAVDAGTDVVHAAFLGLVDQFGVRDVGTAHGDEVHGAAFQNFFCQTDVGDTADDAHGDVGIGLDLLGPFHVEGAVDAHGSGHVVGGLSQAAGDVDGVDASLFQHGQQDLPILYFDAAFHVFGGVDLCRDGEVRTHFLADTTDDFQGEACAVFHAAAIGVSTMVGIGGQELVQDVAVCHVHFHGVEASFLGAACCLAELLHQLVDFGDGQGTGGFAHIRFVGSGDGTHGGGGGLGQTALVDELDGSAAASCVDGGSQLLQAGDHLVVIDAQHVVFQALQIDEGGFHGDEAHAAGCSCGVVVDDTLGHGAVIGGVVGDHGGHDDAVGQFQGAELNGGENLFKVAHSMLFAPFILSFFCLTKVESIVMGFLWLPNRSPSSGALLYEMYLTRSEPSSGPSRSPRSPGSSAVPLPYRTGYR